MIDIAESTDINGSFQDEKDGIIETMGKLTEHLRKSLEDGVLDESEKIRARDMLIDFQGLITRFINEIESFGEK